MTEGGLQIVKRLCIIVVALLLNAALPVGCGQSTRPEPNGPLNVTVSILPQKYFVERVGGEYVTVNVMVEPGASPATYEPKPGQLVALSKAAAYFSIGVPFENAWLDKIASANPDMLMVDTAAGIERVGNDPHIWLSPTLVKTQAQTIYEALVELDPAHEADYEANLDGFVADVETLDTDIRATLERLETKKFMVFHPAWGYFARDYGLEMIPIEIGGQEPSAAELAALVTEAQGKGIKVIFAQPEFSTEGAETIANEIGGEVLLISPLNPEWLDNLRKVAKTFAEVLSP